MFPSLRLLCEAAKLTFTDSYIVLIADTPDLDNFHIIFFHQFESLGTGQLLPVIRLASALGGFEYGVN
jgi:hypothetical protein